MPAQTSNSPVAEFDAPTRATHPAQAYDGLLYTVFQQLRAASSEGVIVALTSANSGEGVTHSVAALVGSLSKDHRTRILQVDSRRLSEIGFPPEEIIQHCQQIDTNIYEFIGVAQASHSWTGNWEYRRDCIQQLRAAFDYILVDCPALNAAGELFSLAPLVDGVIMVVEAGTTRTDQILYAEKSIEFARGKLIGYILNKRTFTVPGWLYKRL
jgi:Mrp family chromosome partitioning ATPase